MNNKEAIELLEKAYNELCKECFTEKGWSILVHDSAGMIDQALALLKEQPPIERDYPNSEFIKVQRLAVQNAIDAYEQDEEWCPTKTTRLLEACDRLEVLEANQPDLLTACKIGLNGLKGVLQIAMEFEAKGKVFTEENKNKHKDNIETVKAAIAKAQPKKVENKDNE